MFILFHVIYQFYFLGYTYKYPFLSSDCGIKVEDNVIKNLFKHMINIEYPTMAFIGVPRNTTGFYLFDFQVIKNSFLLYGLFKNTYLCVIIHIIFNNMLFSVQNF